MGKVQKILSEITTRKLCTMDEHMAFYNDTAKEDYRFLSEIEELIKALQEEPASKELKKAAKDYSNNLDNICGSIGEQKRNAFKAGAKWQKKHLWKDAQGSDLPNFDRDVIALLDNGKVVFAHRPYPKGWDGKSITTGKVEHYTPKTFGKGGWNIPNVRCWLNVGLPKEIEL